MRGIAILLALGWHFNQHPTGIAVIDILLVPGRTIGWAGVDLFFVLSGFLVGGLVFKELKRTGEFRAGRFLVRRAMKIWPIFYVYLALLLISGRHPPEAFVWQAGLHLQNYFVTPLDHLWSLAVEEHFYLALCAASAVLARYAKQRRIAFLWLCAAVPVGCLALRCIAWANGVEPRALQWQSQFRIDSLTCGVFLAYLYQFRPERFARLGRHKLLLFAIAAAGWTVLGTWGANRAFVSTFGYTLAYLTSAAFLLGCIGLPALQRKPLIVRGLAVLGVYSYAMYIYQFVGYRMAEAAFRQLGWDSPPALAELLIRYAGAIGVAIVLTRCVEFPFLALRDRLFPSRAAA